MLEQKKERRVIEKRTLKDRWNGFRRMVYYYLLRLIRVKDKRARVKRGMAIGIAIHGIPLFGFSLLAGLALAFPFRANKVAVTLSNLMSAPLTLSIYSLDALFLAIYRKNFGFNYTWASVLAIVTTFALIYIIGYILAGILLFLMDRHLAERRKKRLARRVARRELAMDVPSGSMPRPNAKQQLEKRSYQGVKSKTGRHPGKE